jgi:hypothetical protein
MILHSPSLEGLTVELLELCIVLCGCGSWFRAVMKELIEETGEQVIHLGETKLWASDINYVIKNIKMCTRNTLPII